MEGSETSVRSPRMLTGALALGVLGGGLVVILLLVGAINATMRAFRRVAPLPAWLLAPYLAWVLFATALNAALWWLARG